MWYWLRSLGKLSQSLLRVERGSVMYNRSGVIKPSGCYSSCMICMDTNGDNRAVHLDHISVFRPLFCVEGSENRWMEYCTLFSEVAIEYIQLSLNEKKVKGNFTSPMTNICVIWDWKVRFGYVFGNHNWTKDDFLNLTTRLCSISAIFYWLFTFTRGHKHVSQWQPPGQ